MAIELEVQRAVPVPGIPGDGEFRDWVASALGGGAAARSVTIRVVGRAESRGINSEYRGRDAATNVLSFSAELPETIARELREQGEPVPLGDLVICAEVVAQEAAAQNKPEQDHWAHLVIHGVLHLLGHDHAETEQAEAMENLERELLAGLGIPDPYATR